MNRMVNQISVKDINLLSGRSVHRFMVDVFSVEMHDWILIKELEGRFSGITEKDSNLMRTSLFLTKIIDAIQYEWGSFFAFGAWPSADITGEWTAALQMCELSVHLVDNEYFYLICDNDALSNYIINKYKLCEHNKVNIENVRIPF